MKDDMTLFCMGCFAQRTSPQAACSVCGYNEAAQETSPHRLRPRTILNGKYLIGRVLGEGGFGITYIAWDLNLRIKVAVKEYYPSGFVTRETTNTSTVQPFTGSQGDFFSKGRDRFVEEARSLAKFRSMPGIVAVSDFFTENGTAYIVMEFIEGQTLKSYLEKSGGKLPANQLFDMMRPVMSSLAEVHKSGMIHRDISPDNLMISIEGNLKLLDFGAARDFTDSGNKSLSIMLKPGFAPEEQYRSRGVQGPWTDVYALSATMYKCITGVTPDESLDRTNVDEVRPPSILGVAISPAQEAALMRGMAVLQRNRFQSMPELSVALYQAAPAPQSMPMAPQPVSVAPQPVSVAQQPMPVQQQPYAPSYAPPPSYGQQPPPYAAQQAAPQTLSGSEYVPQGAPVLEKTSWFKRNKALALSLSGVAAALVVVVTVVVIMMSSGKEEPPLPTPDSNLASAAIPTPASPSPTRGIDYDQRPAFISFAGESYDTDAEEIYLYEMGLTDISEIRWCVGLKVFSAADNQISDISPLRDLINLHDLYLWGNQISDVSPLAELYNLEYLFLGSNQISDISPLRGLYTLEELSLWSNFISDISALRDLYNLRDLSLGNNYISDISPLQELYNLEYRTLWSNQISDVSALSRLTNLKELDLWDNNVSDVSALRNLTNLETLYLDDNPLSQAQVNELRAALPYCDIYFGDYETPPDVPAVEPGGNTNEYYSYQHGFSLQYPADWFGFENQYEAERYLDVINAAYGGDVYRFQKTIFDEMTGSDAYWLGVDGGNLIFGTMVSVSSDGITQQDMAGPFMLGVMQEAYEEEFKPLFEWFSVYEDMKTQRLGRYDYCVFRFYGDLTSNDGAYLEYGFYLATTIIGDYMHMFFFAMPDYAINNTYQIEEMLSSLW